MSLSAGFSAHSARKHGICPITVTSPTKAAVNATKTFKCVTEHQKDQEYLECHLAPRS